MMRLIMHLVSDFVRDWSSLDLPGLAKGNALNLQQLEYFLS
jgi:hypothetical protein